MGDPLGTFSRSASRLFGSSVPTPPAPTAPPAVPDLTDQLVRRSRLAAMQRAGQGAGIDSTFLTGPLGLPPGLPALPTGTGA